jgi:hypothetical protein
MFQQYLDKAKQKERSSTNSSAPQWESWSQMTLPQGLGLSAGFRLSKLRDGYLARLGKPFIHFFVVGEQS